MKVAPFLYEAGLDVDQLPSNPKVMVQGLMLHHVIHKRKLELDDISKGGLNLSCQQVKSFMLKFCFESYITCLTRHLDSRMCQIEFKKESNEK